MISTAQQSTLGSPISLSQNPLKPRTLDEYEAAESLLSLFSTPLKSLRLPFEDHNMDVDPASSLLADLDVSTVPDTPLSPLFPPGYDCSSSSDLPTGDYNMEIDSEFLNLGLGVSESTTANNCLSPFAIPGENISGSSVHTDETRVHVPRLRKERASKVGTMSAALNVLRKARISVTDLLLAILSGEFSEFYSHRLAFLSDSGRIRELLNTIWAEKKSRPTIENWVQDVGLDHICNLVSNEMESAKPLLQMKLKAVSPEYIEQWDVAAIMDPVAMITPTWTKILYAASEPQRRETEDAQNRPTV